VGTCIGLLLSVLLITTVLSYASVKFYQLVTKHNPGIAVSVNTDVYTKEDALVLDTHRIFFAFAVQDFYGR